MGSNLSKGNKLLWSSYIWGKCKPQKIAVYVLWGEDDLALFIYGVNGIVVMKKHFMHILLGGYTHKEYRNHYPTYYLN